MSSIRRFITTSLLTVVLISRSTSGAEVKLEELRAPTSPAFTIIGVEATAVERPSTPREFGMALLTNATGEGGGIEVSPYWLRDRPALTFDADTEPGMLRSLLETFSLSIANAAIEPAAEGGTSPGTNIGVGARAYWFIGKASGVEDAMSKYNQKVAELLLTEMTAAEVTEALRPHVDAIRKAHRAGRWVVEAAAAGATELEGDSWQNARLARWGAWITPAYRLETKETIDVVLVARYLSDRGDAADNNTDIGGRVIWDRGRVAWSAEYVQRLGDDSSERLAAVVQYRVADGLYLTATLGQDFAASDDDDSGRAIALFGLNFSVGNAPRVR